METSQILLAFVALLAVLALAAGCGALARRFIASPRHIAGKGQEGGLILETQMMLSPRQRLMVVRWGKRRLLMLHAGQEVTVLDREMVEEAPEK